MTDEEKRAWELFAAHALGAALRDDAVIGSAEFAANAADHLMSERRKRFDRAKRAARSL